MSNGGKFKLFTVLNGLIFPTPTQPRISFERPIYYIIKTNIQVSVFVPSPETFYSDMADMSHLPYEERLKILEERFDRADLIQMFRLTYNLVPEKMENFCLFSEGRRLRGHEFMIE
jgi:hypothetical protein